MSIRQPPERPSILSVLHLILSVIHPNFGSASCFVPTCLLARERCHSRRIQENRREVINAMWMHRLPPFSSPLKVLLLGTDTEQAGPSSFPPQSAIRSTQLVSISVSNRFEPLRKPSHIRPPTKWVELTGETYRNHSSIMRGHCVGSRASFPSHGARERVVHSDHMKGETISGSHEFNTSQEILPLLAGASHVPSDQDILLTSTRRTYGGSVNPADIVQPPDNVTDYWFHRLGLSLDTPLVATFSDLAGLSSSVSVLGDIDLSVSHIVVILYRIHWCSRCAHNEAGFLIDFL